MNEHWAFMREKMIHTQDSIATTSFQPLEQNLSILGLDVEISALTNC